MLWINKAEHTSTPRYRSVHKSQYWGQTVNGNTRNVDLNQIELYPLNPQIIDKLPPHIIHRDLRRLHTRVVTHEDVLELLQLRILVVLHRLLLLRDREQPERFKIDVQDPLLYWH